jgi:endoglucanase
LRAASTLHSEVGPQDPVGLPALAARARRQRALLVLVAYYLPDRDCSLSGQGAPSPEAYRRWIDQLVGHLGSTRAVIVVEPDAVAADCFDTRRAILLRHSVQRLANAGQYVYLDAGHARWRSTGEMAQRLLGAGIQYAQGLLGQRRQPPDDQTMLPVGTGALGPPRRPRVRGRHLPQRPRPSPR